MDTITFDTLAYSRKLQDCGVPQPQANGMAEAQKEAFDQLVAARQLATKEDIYRLDGRITETQKLIAETAANTERHLTTLLLGIGTAVIAAIGIAVAIVLSKATPVAQAAGQLVQ